MKYRKLNKRLELALCIMERSYYQGMGENANLIIILSVLSEPGEWSQKKIRDYWMVPLTTINFTVSKLRENGYVTLEPIPKKRRECYIHLTESGRKYAAEILAPFDKVAHEAMRETLKFHPAEFIDALECYANNLRRLITGNGNDHKTYHKNPDNEREEIS